MKIGRKEYVKLDKDNPVKFLIKSESACFRKIDDGLMALNEEMERFLEDTDFVREMMDGVQYRKLRYYEEKNF